MRKSSNERLFAVFALLSVTFAASATCGSVDYSQGAEALHNATTWLGALVISLMDLLFAIAGIVVVISALQIYLKINNHEGDITKSILYLFGGMLFMIFISLVAPAIFGYENLMITY